VKTAGLVLKNWYGHPKKSRKPAPNAAVKQRRSSRLFPSAGAVHHLLLRPEGLPAPAVAPVPAVPAVPVTTEGLS